MIEFALERESTLTIIWLPNDGTLQSDLFDILRISGEICPFDHI